MHTEFRIVWVSSYNPDIIEDVFADGIECLDDLKQTFISAKNTPADGLDWVARVQRVTYEFI